MKSSAILLALSLSILTVPSFTVFAETQTLTFQEGDGGAYSNTHGAFVPVLAPGGDGVGALMVVSIDQVVVDFAVGKRSYLWFPDIFGGNLGQIPLESSIESASLELVRVGSGSQGESLRRIIEAWDEGTITGVNYPASSGSVGSIPPAAAGSQTVDITAVVQAWASGTANWGLELSTGSLTLFTESFYSDDAPLPADRPKLSVTFTPPLAATESTTWGKVKALYR